MREAKRRARHNSRSEAEQGKGFSTIRAQCCVRAAQGISTLFPGMPALYKELRLEEGKVPGGSLASGKCC